MLLVFIKPHIYSLGLDSQEALLVGIVKIPPSVEEADAYTTHDGNFRLNNYKVNQLSAYIYRRWYTLHTAWEEQCLTDLT